MPTIQIDVPDAAVNRFLHAVLGVHGHRHLAPSADGSEPSDLDALIVDPSPIDCLRRAQALRRARPTLPIICVSPRRPSQEAEELGPVRYLHMPFRVSELEAALADALE